MKCLSYRSVSTSTFRTPNCRPFNSRLALQLAKQNVEREYAVVGTWEHTNETLAVLEAYVPRYFADASKMYYCKSRDDCGRNYGLPNDYLICSGSSRDQSE